MMRGKTTRTTPSTLLLLKYYYWCLVLLHLLVLCHYNIATTGSSTTATVITAKKLLASSPPQLLPFDPNQHNLIGSQPHSVNDFRAWPSLLRKGAQYLKIDPYYMPRQFCSSLPAQYYSPQVRNDPRGCLLFTHDTPVIIPSAHYNTTEHLWQFVIEHRQQFSRGDDFTIYIALCFKKGKGCGSAWHQLVDDFFRLANEIIEKYDLNLELLLDGDAKPEIPCFYKAWMPWNSVWIEEPYDALFSNNQSKAYNRFQLINVPTRDNNAAMKRLKAVKYGKFLSDKKYPFLVWEPSDQMEILSVLNDYLSGGPGLINKQGLKFAINIDPIQFDVYSRNVWNIPVAMDLDPFVVTLHDTTSSSNFTILSIFGKSGRYGIWTSDKILGSIYQHFNDHKLPAALASTRIISVSSQNRYVMISDLQGYYSILRYDFVERSLATMISGSFKGRGATVASSLAFVDGTESYFVSLFASLQPNEGCSLSIQSHVSRKGSYRYKPNGQGINGWCLVSGSVKVENTSLSSTSVKSLNLRAGTDMRTMGSVFYSSSNNIFGCTFEVLWNSTTLEFVRIESQCSQNPVHVGRSPSVSVISYQNVVYVLEVHTDSYCYYTEEHNKDPVVKMCDHKPVSSTNVMTYTFAEWVTLKEHFQIRSHDTMITTCMDRMLHGTFDMGQHPSASLFLHRGEMGVVEMHNGVLKQGFDDQSGCGTAVLYDEATIILDSWNMTQLL